MVLSILGVVSVIGLSFLYMSQMQLKGTASYLARLQTKYLAEAGISYVRKILELDSAANKVDSDDELWHTTFSGEDVDIDGDGKNESKWFYVKDGLGNDVGRYAVLVQDESAKVNLNGDGTIIKKLFDNLKLDGTAIAEDILKYRYGPDQKPAVANTDDNSNKESLEEDSLDNDSDGLIDEADEGVDEPQEFNVENPKDDDRPFVVIDELKKILGVDGEKFK